MNFKIYDDELSKPIEYETILLEMFEARVNTVFSNEMLCALNNLELIRFVDSRIGAMVYELRAHLASEKLAYIDIKYPKDWWQAFKERWFPKWILKKYPVQYHEEHYDVRAFYPKISLPQKEHYVRIIKTSLPFLATLGDPPSTGMEGKRG